MSEAKEIREKSLAFFEKIDELPTGERAALKRGAGTMLSEADGRALTAFYRCLPRDVDKQEECWFAAACLRCLWDPKLPSGLPFPKVVGRMLQAEELSDSTAHRVEALLDTRWDNDGYLLAKLFRLIKLIRQKSDGVLLDFPALLDDLLKWNWENQTVQRSWAREIFAPQAIEREEN